MYTKNAKYKQVLNCSKMSEDLFAIICTDFSYREGYTKLVHADFYWHAVQGLVVILDIKEGVKGNILQGYKDYKMLKNTAYPINELGELVWSWN